MTATDHDHALLALARALADPDHPIKSEAAEWARRQLSQRDLVAADHGSVFDLDGWRALAERGVFGLLVPEDMGGAGDDLAAALLTLEGLGLGCADNGLTYAAASQILSTQVVLTRFASAEQRERWLPGLLAGTTFAAFGMTEPETGSDAFSMAARADRLDDGGYRLTAHKSYITFAPIADVAIVFASTRPEAGSWGISAFIVETDRPGVRVGTLREKMGMRTTPFGDLHLDDVVVPPDALIGREGAGASMFTATLDVERSFVFAPQVGAMERQLDEAIAYANHRRQGNRPIGANQAVSHRIVAMKERHERARLFLYRAAMASVTGRDSATMAALAKIVAADVGIESSLDAITIHGARGYVSEFEVERPMRDAIGGLTYSGASDVLRNVVARLLGVG